MISVCLLAGILAVAQSPAVPAPNDAPAEAPAPAKEQLDTDTRQGVHPLVWATVGFVTATAIGLALTLPVGLISGGLTLTSWMTTWAAVGPRKPLDYVGVFVGPMSNLIIWWWISFGMVAVVPLGITAGAITIIASALVSKRRIPWLPTLVVTTLPPVFGCLLGGALGLVLWLASSVLSVGTGLTSTLITSRNVPVPALLGFYLMITAVNLIAPAAVLAGTLMGQGISLGLLVPLDQTLGREVPRGENAIPTEVFAPAQTEAHTPLKRPAR